MNKHSYIKLIEQDIEQLDKAFEKDAIYKLEYEHIKQVLNWSINQIYPPSKWDVRIYSEPIKLMDIIHNLFTVYEFNNMVNEGLLSDDDGTGYWVKNQFASTDKVFNTAQLDAEYVLWFNK